MNFTIVYVFSSADLLGKPDKHSFTQKALMGILISEMSEEFQRKLKDENGDLLEVNEWEGLTTNADGSVKEIYWTNLVEDTENSGSILFDWIPETVEYLDIDHCGFEGELDCRKLPSKLLILDAVNNRLTGTLDLSELPATLADISMDENLLRGEINLSNLPPTVRELSLSKNRFSGTVNLAKLPDSLKYLYLDGNEFSGDINVKSLPGNMRRLHLDTNKFDGTLIVGDLPDTLRELKIENNPLKREICFVGADEKYFEEEFKERLQKMIG